MRKITITQKRALKHVVVSAFREDADLRNLIAEAIEDSALVKAIREGRKTKCVSRNAVCLQIQKTGR